MARPEPSGTTAYAALLLLRPMHAVFFIPVIAPVMEELSAMADMCYPIETVGFQLICATEPVYLLFRGANCSAARDAGTHAHPYPGRRIGVD